MVITLLETCGHYFDRGSSRRKLDRFLIHFQRYTLSKGVLPLDIEFDLQDIFADLRPNMSRYISIEEVNAALAELEEHEGKSTSERQSEIEKRSNSISRNNLVNGQRLANGGDENGGVHEDVIGDSESDSGSGSNGAGDHDDDDDLDDEHHDAGSEIDDDDDDDDDVGPGSDEDGEIHVRQMGPTLDPKEEAEFDRELKALMQESLDSRKLELRSRPTLDMMIPMSILEGSSKDHHGRGLEERESGEDTLDEDHGGNREVRVKVLVRRGHKQQTKQMFIPQDCSLVRSTKQKEAAELEEKQDIKRLVLEYNDREEEELNGVGNQMMGWTQSGVGRIPSRGVWDGSGGRGSGSRHRYHHHSGAGHYYSRRR